MVLQNDYNLDLYNGDIGICFTDPIDEKPKVYFENNDTTFRGFSPLRLPEIQPAYCMAIHKSQGSEFSEVVISLLPEDNKVLSRELLYTTITRAKKEYLSQATNKSSAQPSQEKQREDMDWR